MVDNRGWAEPLSAIDLSRDLGKHFRVGTMLTKDAMTRRLKNEEGISYTESSYQILQTSDFPQLYREYGVTPETSDNGQRGGLVSGMGLIRKVEDADVYVMITPLIIKSDGTKFSEPEGGVIWLDPEMLGPYTFYQFWSNMEDADVIRLLKVFTLMSHEEIKDLERQTTENPGTRAAQRALAKAVTTLVYGTEGTS